EEGKDNSSNTVVDHFHSLVVEVISLLSLEVKQGKTKQMNLESHLSDESGSFLQKWRREATIDLISLFNFLIPCPSFHDMNLFVEMLHGLPDEEFVYHLFGEELDKTMIIEVLENPSSFINNNESILWDSDVKRNFTIVLIQNLTEYRSALGLLLTEVAASSSFTKVLYSHKTLMEEAVRKVKALPMEPLTLAQYIMGKNFRRVSNYKMYYFIPSYFFASKMRIFNPSVCMVIYQCASPISDDLQRSKDLDAKLKAIADPNRLILLRLLSEQKLYGARLAEYLGVTTATVSHHLDLLKKANFIKEEKVGTIKYFTSNKENLEDFLEQLHTFLK
ncbi:MAG: ArsR/SmtB family transcription factor, partial [Heyndrickxia sp.]